MRCFMDCEFTGLRQRTTLISIGCVAEDGRAFYAELTDYERYQVDDWIQANVIDKLYLPQGLLGDWAPVDYAAHPDITLVTFRGDKPLIRRQLRDWLEWLGPVEMWADVLAYDWVLFCQLFGGAMKIPGNVYYIPFDLATAFKLAGIDPDVNRAEFCGLSAPAHNALADANLIKACYEKLQRAWNSAARDERAKR